MKLVILNFSGNVGKTLICSNMLLPRMPNAYFVAVETINADEGTQDETIKAKHFRTLREALFGYDEVIADIGASNVEEVINQMKKHEGSHEDVDYFLIPTTPVYKQVKDTLNTMTALIDEVGIEPKKIKIIFNKIDDVEDMATTFKPIIDFCNAHKIKTNLNCYISDNEIYQLSRKNNLNVYELANDATDYRSLFRASSDKQEKDKYIKMVSMIGLAKSANRELENAFNLLFGNIK